MSDSDSSSDDNGIIWDFVGKSSLPPDERKKLRKLRKARCRRPKAETWPSPHTMKIGVERFRASYPEPPPSHPSLESLECLECMRAEVKRFKEVMAKILTKDQNANSPPVKKLKTFDEKSEVTSRIDSTMLDDSLDEDLLTRCSQTAEETFKQESESIAHNTSANVQSNIGHLQEDVPAKSAANEHSATDGDLLDGDEDLFLNEELGTY